VFGIAIVPLKPLAREEFYCSALTLGNVAVMSVRRSVYQFAPALAHVTRYPVTSPEVGGCQKSWTVMLVLVMTNEYRRCCGALGGRSTTITSVS